MDKKDICWICGCKLHGVRRGKRRLCLKHFRQRNREQSMERYHRRNPKAGYYKGLGPRKRRPRENSKRIL